MQDLIAWKNREDRKPLILLGARQVGKTYILKEFGQREFENVAYINCDNNAMAKDLFASDYNIDRILLTIGAITGVNIEAGKTLIIMDEIQELHLITAKPKAHAFKNEMCFPLTKTKCELKKHPNSKFECFFNDFNRTKTSLFLFFPSKQIQDNLVCVLELQE